MSKKPQGPSSTYTVVQKPEMPILFFLAVPTHSEPVCNPGSSLDMGPLPFQGGTLGAECDQAFHG